MDRKQELQERIVQGIQRVDYLAKLGAKLSRGKARDEAGEKSVRLLFKLHDQEDGFIELYPGECLFGDRRCSNPNIGCFPCWDCLTFLNALYGSSEAVIPKLL